MTTIDRIFLLEIATFAIAIDKVPQRTAARCNRPLQNRFNGFYQ